MSRIRLTSKKDIMIFFSSYLGQLMFDSRLGVFHLKMGVGVGRKYLSPTTRQGDFKMSPFPTSTFCIVVHPATSKHTYTFK